MSSILCQLYVLYMMDVLRVVPLQIDCIMATSSSDDDEGDIANDFICDTIVCS